MWFLETIGLLVLLLCIIMTQSCFFIFRFCFEHQQQSTLPWLKRPHRVIPLKHISYILRTKSMQRFMNKSWECEINSVAYWQPVQKCKKQQEPAPSLGLVRTPAAEFWISCRSLMIFYGVSMWTKSMRGKQLHANILWFLILSVILWIVLKVQRKIPI